MGALPARLHNPQGIFLCLTHHPRSVSNRSLGSSRLGPQSHLGSQGSSLRQGGDTVDKTNTAVEEMWYVQERDGHGEIATDQRPNT